MKVNKKGILLKVIIPAVIIAGTAAGIFFQGRSAAKIKDETIVVMKDVSKTDAEKDNPLRIEKGEKIEFKEKIRDIIALSNANSSLIEKDNEIYLMNLKDKSIKNILTKFKTFEIITASESGKKILYEDKANNVYAYDFALNKSTLLFKSVGKRDEGSDVQFADAEGRFAVLFRFFPKSGFVVANCETGESKKVDLNNKELKSNFIYTMDGKEIYFRAGNKKENKSELSVINLDESEEIKSVFENGESNIFHMDIINDGKSMIFSGEYNKEEGIFIYDLEKKSIVKVVSGGKDNEGVWCPTYSLSPDQKRIVFDMITNEPGLNNIFVAKLEENELQSKTLIMEKVDLGAVIMISTNWNQDSNSFLVKKMDYSNSDKKVIYVETFNLK